MSDRAASDEDRARAEHRARAPARLVTAIYRLVKACLLHGDQNDAVAAQLPGVSSALHEFCALRDAESARVVFAADVAFVNRRLLKGSRDVAAIANELGALLQKGGANEVLLERTAPAEAIGRLARAIADAQRDKGGVKRLAAIELPGIALRWLDRPNEEALPELDESRFARAVRHYASSVLLVRAFYDELAEGGAAPSLNRVKHVAHRLVSLANDEPQLLVALAASRLPDADPGRLAVATAAIAVAAARQVTAETAHLSTLAMAALVADAGRVHLGGDAKPERAAAHALALFAAQAGLHPASVRRGVLVFEALTGQAPTGLARILRAARRLNALRVPSTPGARDQVGLDVAIELLRAEASDELDHATVDLVVAGLGFYPLGTLVELTTGEIAIVNGAPALSVDFARPPVRVLGDRPFDLDLAAAPKPGAPARAVRRALAATPDDLARVESLAAGRRLS
jgi:hypothetical protein